MVLPWNSQMIERVFHFLWSMGWNIREITGERKIANNAGNAYHCQETSAILLDGLAISSTNWWKMNPSLWVSLKNAIASERTSDSSCSGEKRCMSAIYWQTRDCWPVISGRPLIVRRTLETRMVYAILRHPDCFELCIAPVMLSCEQSWMTAARMSYTRYITFTGENHRILNVTNESGRMLTGLKWRNAIDNSAVKDRMPTILRGTGNL